MAMDRRGPHFTGSAYRFYGEVCSRCTSLKASHAAKEGGKGLRYDRQCGADHYDQVKLVRDTEPKVAHVMSGYRHPLKQYDGESEDA